MIYIVGKFGALLPNGSILKPGVVVMFSPLSYWTAANYEDFKTSKNIEQLAIDKDSELALNKLISNNVLVKISKSNSKNAEPLTKKKYKSNMLVVDFKSRQPAIISNAKYDYNQTCWMYSVKSPKFKRKIDSEEGYISWSTNCLKEDEIELVEEGVEILGSFDMDGEKYPIYYEVLKGGK